MDALANSRHLQKFPKYLLQTAKSKWQMPNGEQSKQF
jgi:hypothetical protein